MQQVTYRTNLILVVLGYAQVKVKNPSLLLQLQRTPPRFPGMPPPPQSPAQTSKPFYP